MILDEGVSGNSKGVNVFSMTREYLIRVGVTEEEVNNLTKLPEKINYLIENCKSPIFFLYEKWNEKKDEDKKNSNRKKKLVPKKK